MPFRFEAEWLEADRIRGDELSATWASLLIGVDDEIVTRVVDERARTVRDHICVPLYVLAEWLAPAGALVHLVWTPDRLDNARIEFLREGQTWIESDEFRDCCSDFVDQVIRRLLALGVEGTLLQEEWAAIQAADTEESKFCRVAAGLGWDPYALDDAERAAVLRLEDVLSEVVLEEAAAVLDAGDLDAEVAAVVSALETGKAASLSLERLRSLPTIRPVAGGGPWDAGYSLAQHLRRQLELDGAPLASMAALGHAIGEAPDAVENVTQPRHFGAAALLDGVVTSDANGRPAFAIRRGRDEARRFQFCRGLAEVLVSPGADALLTQARSARQQRSRAFAAEFLAPSSGLRARVSGAVVGEDNVDALAAEFGVSPWLVAHQLRNHEIARIR